LGEEEKGGFRSAKKKGSPDWREGLQGKKKKKAWLGIKLKPRGATREGTGEVIQ